MTEHVPTMEMLSARNPPRIWVQKVRRKQEILARTGTTHIRTKMNTVVSMALQTFAETQTMRLGPGVTQRIRLLDGSFASKLVQVQYSRKTISGTPVL